MKSRSASGILIATILLSIYIAVIVFSDHTAASAQRYAISTTSADVMAEDNGSLSPWQYTTSMNTPRFAFAAVATDKYIYAIGGRRNNGALNSIDATSVTDNVGPTVTPVPVNTLDSVERASINDNGKLGTWEEISHLSVPRKGHAAVLFQTYIYVIGGEDPEHQYTVERTRIKEDGSLEEWEIISRMNYGHAGHSATVLGNRIYVIGGNSPNMRKIEYTTINDDGSLGGWLNATATSGPFAVHGAVAFDGNIYAIGGVCCPDNRVEQAAINSDGSLTAWTEGTSMNVGRGGLQTISIDDQIYAIGGCSIEYGCGLDTVERTTIATDGTLGTWLNLQPMLEKRWLHASVVAHGYLYRLGGADRWENEFDTVEYVSLASLVPDSDYGISINQGSLFTNQVTVTLELSAPWGTTEVSISNDGGFVDTVWEPFESQKAWVITSYGSYVIPRVVYIKFKTDGNISGVYQDDIILDITPPTGTVEFPVGVTSRFHQEKKSSLLPLQDLKHQVYVPHISKSIIEPDISTELNLSASDDVSGVGWMLISNRANFEDAVWEPYTPTRQWMVRTAEPTTVYVRFRDNAGNQSDIVSAIFNP